MEFCDVTQFARYLKDLREAILFGANRFSIQLSCSQLFDSYRHVQIHHSGPDVVLHIATA